MADKTNSAKEPIYESRESLYAKAVKKMNADQLIVQFAFKIENYEKAVAMFDEVGDYLDAPELAKRCRELVEETKKDEIRMRYEKALERKAQLKTVADYEKLETVFADLGDYENASQERTACKEKITALSKKSNRIRAGVVAGVIACTGLVIAGFTTGFFRYMKGICYTQMGYYDKAEVAFEGLGSFMDSELRLQQCADVLQAQKEKTEIKTLAAAKAGDTVTFGAYDWKVLERADDQVYLIVSKIKEDSELRHVAYHEVQEDIAWEDTSLNEWIKTEILENDFSEGEREMLLPLSEKNTGSKEKDDAGNEEKSGVLQENAVSYISILTLQEAEQYKEILNTLGGADYWLRSPGAQPDLAAFVTAADEIMDYGYPVSSRQLSVRPVILVNGSEKTEEVKE